MRVILALVGWLAVIFSLVNVAVTSAMRGPAIDVGATVSIVCLLGGLALLGISSIIARLDKLAAR